MKLKHQGINTNRLTTQADNPREAAFAKRWKKQQRNRGASDSLLALILTDWPNNPSPYRAAEISQRDAAVAAAVIQWLGTNVGVSFLADVINASPELKKYLRQCCCQEEVKRLKGA